MIKNLGCFSPPTPHQTGQLKTCEAFCMANQASSKESTPLVGVVDGPCRRCVRWCVPACAAATIAVAGGAATVGGLIAVSMAALSAPADNFQLIPGGCTIESASTDRQTMRSSEGYYPDFKCVEWRQYRFCLPATYAAPTAVSSSALAAAECFSSDEESQEICDKPCEYCTNVTSPTPRHEDGEAVACWEPVAGYSAAFPYTCGNAQCYKVTECVPTPARAPLAPCRAPREHMHHACSGPDASSIHRATRGLVPTHCSTAEEKI